MTELVRTLLLLLLAGGLVTVAAVFATWWFETGRKLRRALRRVLGDPPECEALDVAQARAAGLDFDTRSLAVLWNGGASGLVYAFNEIEGAELIVDGRVSARTTRVEPRRPLDEMTGQAERVALRLVFSDPRFPEFELELFGPGSHLSDAAEGVRLGRRWLSHVEAVLKRPASSEPPPLVLQADDGDGARPRDD